MQATQSASDLQTTSDFTTPRDFSPCMVKLSKKMEDHRTYLKGVRFYQLNKIEDLTVEKLARSLDQLFPLILSPTPLEPKFFTPYVEAMIALKLTFDEKNSRGNRVTRKVNHLLANPFVSKAAFVTAGVGLSVATIAFGIAWLFDKEPALYAIVITGTIFGIGGAAAGVLSEGLKSYYRNIHVTESRKQTQAAFNAFFYCYLRQDFDGCHKVLDELSILDRLILTNETILLVMNDKQNKEKHRLEQEQKDKLDAINQNCINDTPLLAKDPSKEEKSVSQDVEEYEKNETPPSGNIQIVEEILDSTKEEPHASTTMSFLNLLGILEHYSLGASQNTLSPSQSKVGTDEVRDLAFEEANA